MAIQRVFWSGWRVQSSMRLSALWVILALATACGDEDPPPGSEAQRRGVGAACTSNQDCTEVGQTCLAFKGGYCGVQGCGPNVPCPAGSACVAHDDGKNYCFLVCGEKPECNLFRPIESESNCSSSITFAVSNPGKKACVPPS
ncbi:MAG: hypothetical protein SFV15_23680 [Polyangiaceae bacterium]|nr:hypothetical protein [Polyangiaceae bacterium]